MMIMRNTNDTDHHEILCDGLVAAKGNNSIHIAGVTWQSKVAALKVFKDDSPNIDVSSVVEALNYASIDNEL